MANITGPIYVYIKSFSYLRSRRSRRNRRKAVIGKAKTVSVLFSLHKHSRIGWILGRAEGIWLPFLQVGYDFSFGYLGQHDQIIHSKLGHITRGLSWLWLRILEWKKEKQGMRNNGIGAIRSKKKRWETGNKFFGKVSNNKRRILKQRNGSDWMHWSEKRFEQRS